MALKFVDVIMVPVIEPVPQKVLVESQTFVEALVTEYIDLHQTFQSFNGKAIVGRMDTIKKELQALANDTMDEDKPAVFTSAQGELEFSPRGRIAYCPEPLLLVQELLEKYGPDVTANVVDIAITQLRKVLSEHELKHYLVERLGARTLKSVRPVK